ncbi:alpha,alpha-trehalase [Dyadobacter jejuensis]|uniref:Alpha,alpha-trehalase n=1 Tax=Dyadobacter jejuensis TaxID=1082580 RepID=A0A316AZB4_9BACT|nr:alpha,alpha-trehalase TreF [Dyadobacter jejuensis]PWJ55577.1 alpha,alpha-trehalase [Dyadobacter jejuensis]
MPYGFSPVSHTFLQAYVSPEDLYGVLFEDIQRNHIFEDCKTFVDCIPLWDPMFIIEKYHIEKESETFDLKQFVSENFRIPKEIKSDFRPEPGLDAQTHIHQLWPVLIRQPEDLEQGGSLISLPFPYVVPGGRFREIYYWDSYFTMLGLRESGRNELIENMVNNFAYLINNFGFVPTANRTYYLSRSQPPFFALMVNLFSEMEGKKVLKKYLPQLQKEYDYWMDPGQSEPEPYTAHRRLVYLPNGQVLNRYWDDKCTPRPEAFREDEELAERAHKLFGTPPAELYRHIRAAAESGWDFSSRWFEDENEFASIKTTDIIPIDLNCLLYLLELTLAEAYRLKDKFSLQKIYEAKAIKRKKAIRHYLWNEEKNFFMDYDFKQKNSTHSINLAGAFPLFFKLASKTQSHFVRSYIRLNFLKSGGLLTTTVRSGQQWDAPNGWAPLQWVAYKGLRNYNFHHTANTLRAEWLEILEKEFNFSGKMLEKYNVSDTNMVATNGEYEIQEGFGWTNGVYLRMKNKKN